MAWTFTFSTELNPITLYSAVVATGVAIWQVYTYFRDGPRLRLTTGGNRELVGGGHVDPNTYIVVNAVNVGNRATTIQAVGMCVYDNWWRRFRRKASRAYIINVAAPGNVVPHVLEPGHSFMGLGRQTPEVVKLSREKLTYLLVSHSVGKRDLLVRLQPIDDRLVQLKSNENVKSAGD
jgi:hypothetical protein